MLRIETPLTLEKLLNLEAGQFLYLSGIIYTARDQAHKRLVELIRRDAELPFNLKESIIYYCGPTPAPKERVIGSCGPTTSLRMDGFIEPLLKRGLRGMIGKGRRSLTVRRLLKKYKAIYFLAPSGCGALLAKKVLSKKLVAFGELGPEAIYRLEVKDFPLIVGIDSRGVDIYENIE